MCKVRWWKVYHYSYLINKNLSPVTYDGPYVVQLREQLVSVDDDSIMSSLLTLEDDDGRSDYCGVYTEFP